MVDKVKDLPKDVQIVDYCSRPRATTEHIVRPLRGMGYDKTAVLYEGIFGWMNLGYPFVPAEGIVDETAEIGH